MICTKCGHNNVDEALFCEECGNRLGAGAGPQPGPAQQPYAAPQQPYAAPQQPYAQQPYMQQDMGQQPYMAPQPEKKGVGFAVTSMVCGIVSLVLSCCVPYVPFILALIGVVLGGVSLYGRRGGKGMAIAGLVTSIISLIPAVFMIIVGASVIGTMGLM